MRAALKPDKDVTDFIAETIGSLVEWELLVFLWNNPGITDKAEGVAARLGRRRQDLVGPLESLAKHHILKKWGEEPDPIFMFKPSPKTAQALDKFMQLNGEKEGKLFIWSQLLHKGLR